MNFNFLLVFVVTFASVEIDSLHALLCEATITPYNPPKNVLLRDVCPRRPRRLLVGKMLSVRAAGLTEFNPIPLIWQTREQCDVVKTRQNHPPSL